MAKSFESIDPRTRLTFVLVVSSLAVVMSDPLWLAGLWALSWVMLRLSNAPLDGLWAKVRRFVPLLLALFLVQSLFTSGGTPVLQVGGWTLVTREGVQVGLSVVLRLLIVMTSAVLLFTSDPMRLVLGLIRWKVPYEIAFLVLLAMRFLPLLQEEVQDTMTAVQLRGVRVTDVPWGARLKVYQHILLPVVVGAIQRARHTAIAMEARGFRACATRTYLENIALTAQDRWLISTFLISGLAALLFLWRS